MSGKFTAGSASTKGLTDFNALVALLNNGNMIPRWTQAQIEALVSATTDIIVFNTTSNNLEFWHGANDVRTIC